ncbi:hypothetical protein F1D05_01135 [Kribbella qitaiheensis]|uniref:Uncharacterized protein n=1 Tax=Kribbella qitaiheensis TaxID=1544730 RepID=A0A7G6WRZ0_9ACTN|nr:hypothetical protein [Kribbella qitaiheensis]QNE16755.1 hypothetical protein F1D05_01135 [Kribbella qitaiheensis]
MLKGIATSASAFEQFHAPAVASLMVSSLSPAERDELAAPLQNPDLSRNWSTDTSRSSLVQTILDRLQSLRTDG